MQPNYRNFFKHLEKWIVIKYQAVNCWIDNYAANIAKSSLSNNNYWQFIVLMPFKKEKPYSGRNVIVPVKYTNHVSGLRLSSLSKKLCYIISFLCLFKTSQDAICNFVTRMKPWGTSANKDLRLQIKHIFMRTSSSSTRQHATVTCDCFISSFLFRVICDSFDKHV